MATVILQARLGSIRFPKKVLYPLPDGRRIIDTMIDTARSSRASNVCVVTPDAELYESIQDTDVILWDGPRDVLSEFWTASQMYKDNIIRLTADCPMLTSDVINTVLEAYKDVDYICNTHDSDPKNDGFDVEIFSYHSLNEAYEKAVDPYDREHVTPYIRRHFKCGFCDMPAMEGRSINTYEDYIEVCRLIENYNGSTSKRNRRELG